jgi:hypothetical protein
MVPDETNIRVIMPNNDDILKERNSLRGLHILLLRKSRVATIRQGTATNPWGICTVKFGHCWKILMNMKMPDTSYLTKCTGNIFRNFRDRREHRHEVIWMLLMRNVTATRLRYTLKA